MLSVEAWIAVIVALVSALGWLFRLEGRITSHEKVCEERQIKLTERQMSIQEQLRQVNTTVEHIADRLDRVLEGR